MRTYLEHLKTMDENTLVILTDSRSVLCCRPYTQFNKAFTSYGRDIVVGMEMFCDNLLDDSASPHQTCTPLTQYWKYNNVQSTPVRKYVNDGLIAGKAKALVQLFTFLLENKCGQLQMGLGKYMNTHPEYSTSTCGFTIVCRTFWSWCILSAHSINRQGAKGNL